MSEPPGPAPLVSVQRPGRIHTGHGNRIIRPAEMADRYRSERARQEVPQYPARLLTTLGACVRRDRGSARGNDEGTNLWLGGLPSAVRVGMFD